MSFMIPCAIYAFANPDLEINDGQHCYVEPGYMVPVPYGEEPTRWAIDVTERVQSLFLWGFIINAIGVMFVLCTINLYLMDKSERPIWITSTFCSIFALSCAWICGLIAYSITFTILLRRTETLICLGFYALPTQTESYPYMFSSGNFLRWMNYFF